MCVILACSSTRPTLKTLESAEKANSDGGSIAWIIKGQTQWVKNIMAKDIFEISKIAPFPFAIHFRIATHGGKTPELCHPFPVTEGSELYLRGTAPKVLFHNGMWNDWAEQCLQVVINRNVRFLRGQLSDTRAMAWLTYHCGEEVLRLLGEKVAVLDKSGLRIYGDGWTEEKGIFYSNKSFEYVVPCYDYSRTQVGLDGYETWPRRQAAWEKDREEREKESYKRNQEQEKTGAQKSLAEYSEGYASSQLSEI